MKILGLIPARGGSKRLPGKNIKLLGDFPLIAWTIDNALKSNVCVEVCVSTDDPKIADIARQYGATVNGLRPAELASDTASSVDVALHALDQFEVDNGPLDGLMLLQPTSPFRRSETIRQALELFRSNGSRPVVSVSPAKPNPAWSFRVDNGKLAPAFGWEKLQCRSQDLEPMYVVNGALYLLSPETLRTEHKFITNDTSPLIMECAAESLDIDTKWDWMIAEMVLHKNYLSKESL